MCNRRNVLTSFEISSENLGGLHEVTLRPALLVLLLMQFFTSYHTIFSYAYTNSVDLRSSRGTSIRVESMASLSRSQFLTLAVEIGIFAELSQLEPSGDLRL